MPDVFAIKDVHGGEICTIDADGNINAVGTFKVDGVAVAAIDTSGNLSFADTKSIILGTGSDDTIAHDATNTLWAHVTGNLTFDNQVVDKKTIMLLGTDTTATAFEVQNNSAAAIFSVTPASSTTGTALVAGVLDLNGTLDQDAALTGTGDGANIAVTMSHATQVAEALDVTMSQITNARTAGTITAIKATVVSLNGSTAGVDHYAYEAAVTAGDADSDHFAFKVGAGFNAIIDASSCATGEADVILPDNVAIGFQFREASTAYLTLVTTNDAERITAGKIFAETSTTVDMANAAHALVPGTAGAGETKLLGNVVFCDANGGSAALTLPAAASMAGVTLRIYNTGGEDITLADVLTGATISTTEFGVFSSNGTAWYGGVGKLT